MTHDDHSLESFIQDKVGNRLSRTLNGVSTAYTMAATSNRLASVGGVARTYDLAGNQVADGTRAFTYDDRGRLSGATTPQGPVTYAVNALGQRVRKTVGTITTHYAYDLQGHLLGEYDAAGQPIQEFAWVGDTPVAVLKAGATGLETFPVWTDRLDTPRLVTDTTGQSRWTWPNTDPFGANAANENPVGLGSFRFNLRFPGQYYDTETGTHYNYFRDYDPAIGKYVQSDPIGLGGGNNTYAYAGGSPLVFVDPDGLAYFCMYSQSSGGMSCFGDGGKGKQVIDGKCYAGKGQNKNNPGDQCVKNMGPLPRGWYDIGSGYNHRRLGNPTFNLNPQTGTNMCMRDLFRIHADSSAHPGDASDGCIVCSKSIRDQLQRGGSGGTLLVTQ